MAERRRVVVAMSGGVDSSVAAALLVQQGYEVIGIMLRLWSEPEEEAANRCCTPEAMTLARRVAARLGIPFYAVDAQQIFRQTVVEQFIAAYGRGETPNPCLVCNRLIRWDFLLKHALALGADFLATGHYARLLPPVPTVEDAPRQLLRGLDRLKDQSYVLSVLNQAQLRHALFPLGEYTKPQVRQLGRDFGLPVAERADSQDLCFVGEGDYRRFLRRYAPQVEAPGPILTRSGRQIGRHNGLAFYTIGQRKGLGISAAEPLYVLAKDTARNALIVGTAAELGGQELTARQVNWIAGEPPAAPLRLQVKIRYRASEAWGLVTPLDGGRAHVRFDAPLRDITPGQQAVFYAGEVVLGGGVIE